MVFEGFFSSLSSLLPVTKQKVKIDQPIFQLHRLTTALLLCLCIITTIAIFIGDPIACTFSSENEILNEKVVNAYCWISSFTLPKNYHRNSSVYGSHGFGNPKSTDEKVYHAYYQWVPFILLLQAFVIYVPHWLWKSWEGGKVAAVTLDLNSVVMHKDCKEKTRQLAEYLHSSLHHHKLYTIKFLFCDVLNVIITLVNICLMNELFGGKFISYGIDILFSLTNDDESINPMTILFPRVTKCTFRSVGSSGSLQSHDFLCVLPHNIIYARMYLFLWTWFWILLVCGAVEIIWRCLIFFVHPLRRYVLQKYAESGLNKDMKNLFKKLDFGDYFLLSLLHKNLGNVLHSSFRELMMELSMSGSKNNVEDTERVAQWRKERREEQDTQSQLEAEGKTDQSFKRGLHWPAPLQAPQVNLGQSHAIQDPSANGNSIIMNQI